MIIVGAGLAGLLAGTMLRGEHYGIVEKAISLPNNHTTLLRFQRTDVADVTGIQFKRVKVFKTYTPWKNPIADAMAYSKKTNGSYLARSILNTSNEPATRYIAPGDFIDRLQNKCGKITFGIDGFSDTRGHKAISTIPMPVLMDLVGWKKPEFRSVRGFYFKARVRGADAYWSIYTPDPAFLPYRISMTGDVLMVEMARDPGYGDFVCERLIAEVCSICGIDQEDVCEPIFSEQQYGKILPIDENERRKFIMHMTEKYGVYSLGRFATWRPGLLLDDVVNDVRVIQRLAASNNGESYSHKTKV